MKYKTYTVEIITPTIMGGADSGKLEFHLNLVGYKDIKSFKNYSRHECFYEYKARTHISCLTI